MKPTTDLQRLDPRPEDREVENGNEQSRACDCNAFEPPAETDEPSDLDEFTLIDADDGRWDVFILDDDDCDPLPDYGDFWMPD